MLADNLPVPAGTIWRIRHLRSRLGGFFQTKNLQLDCGYGHPFEKSCKEERPAEGKIGGISRQVSRSSCPPKKNPKG